MKTRDRILEGSLELFNLQGERNVTTNHIAAHLGMSPGNLYYHFRNKQDIVYELFLTYRHTVERYLGVTAGSLRGLEEQHRLLEAVFTGLWRYRFLHRELEHYLESDPRLGGAYRDFTHWCLERIGGLLDGLAQAGVQRTLSPAERQGFKLNLWLIITNWLFFLKTVSEEGAAGLSQASIKRGVFPVLCLQLPYLTPPYRLQVEARLAELAEWPEMGEPRRAVQAGQDSDRARLAPVRIRIKPDAPD